MEEGRIYKTLDNVPRFLFWTFDEFLLLAIPVFLGLLVGSFLLMALGFALRPIYKRMKKKYKRGSMMHALYWRLPKRAFKQMGILKRIPGSHYRKLVL